MSKKIKEGIDKSAKRAKAATDKAAAAAKKTTDRAAKALKEATDNVAAGATLAADSAETASATLRASGDKLKASGEKLAKQGSAVSIKVIEHAEANTREAFVAMRAAASAKNATQVAKIQGDYLRDQGARALAHAREIGELIMKFGRDAVETEK